jgi:hypothetical protein
MKLIVNFCNYSNAPKKKTPTFCPRSVFCIYLRPSFDFHSIQHKMLGFITEMKCYVYIAPAIKRRMWR